MVDTSTESTPRERLARMVVLVKRSRRYALGAALLAAVLASLSLGLAVTTKRVWHSETTIVFRDAVKEDREGESPAQRSARLGPRLKEMVLARTRLAAMVEELGLYPELTARSMLEAVDELQKNVVFRVRSPDTFSLSFTSDDPALAQRVASRLASMLIEDYGKENLASAEVGYDVQRRELRAADELVLGASRALARFLAQNPLFTWGVGDSPYAPTLPAPGTAGPAAPQAAARSEAEPSEKRTRDPVLARLLQRITQIDAELGGVDKAGSPLAPVTFGDAQKQRDAAAAALEAAELDLSAKLVRLTPVHPDAISAKMKADAARATLKLAEKNLEFVRTGAIAPKPVSSGSPSERRLSLEEERRAIAAELSDRRVALQKSAPRGAGETKVDANAAGARDGTVELETEWHRLRLDLERARDHFRKAQDKERIASLARDAAARERQEELVVVDPAYLPVKPDRGRGRVFFAGSFFAVVLAFAYAGARVLLDDTLYDEVDVEARGAPPLLLSVPRFLSPLATPNRAELGPLRVLRHRLELRRAGKSLIVHITSPGRAEGKSEVAARLAITLAEEERASVVLVDANLEAPRIAALFGIDIPKGMGFSEQVKASRRGVASPLEVVHVAGTLSALAEPPPPSAFPEVIHSPSFPVAIRELAERFDYVILDGAPVLGSGDANVLEDASDVSILLARAGRTQGSDLMRAKELLGERRFFGMVLNDAPTASAKGQVGA